MIAAARKRARWGVPAGIAVVAVFAAAAVLGRGSVSSPPTAEPAPDAPTTVTGAPLTATPPADQDTERFADPESGFSIDYPATWRRLAAPDKQVRLLVTDKATTSLLVRDAPLGLEVTPDTLGVARDFTDTLVRADSSVRMLAKPEFVTLDGLPGVRYRYTFNDGRGGGAHVHYFLFKGSRLLTLVFQVPGARALERRSGLLDRVAGSFQATDT